MSRSVSFRVQFSRASCISFARILDCRGNRKGTEDLRTLSKPGDRMSRLWVNGQCASFREQVLAVHEKHVVREEIIVRALIQARNKCLVVGIQGY